MPKAPTPTYWLSIDEAAAILGLSSKTVRRYIAAGRLEAKRVGPKLIRVALASVEAFGDPVTFR